MPRADDDSAASKRRARAKKAAPKKVARKYPRTPVKKFGRLRWR